MIVFNAMDVFALVIVFLALLFYLVVWGMGWASRKLKKMYRA